MKKYVVAILALALLVGCGGSGAKDRRPIPVGPKTNIRLSVFASCDDMKAHMIEEMKRKLIAQNSTQCRYVSSGSDDGYISDAPTAGSTESDAHTYTDTNIQEVGVDEADLVKTDGNHLYVTTSTGVDVFQIWPLAEFAKIASVSVRGKTVSLYLIEDQLAVISNIVNSTKNAVIVTIFNVSNPTEPNLLRESIYEGSLIDSRAVENVAHLVLSNHLISIPSLDYSVPYNDLPPCEGDVDYVDHPPFVAAIEKLTRENTETLNNWDISSALIDVEHHFFNGLAPDDSFVVDCTNIMKSDAVSGDNFTSVVSIDLDNLTGNDKIATMVGDGYIVYSSTDSIYVASPRNVWYSGYYYRSGNPEETVIHRFELSDDRRDTEYLGSTSVPGHILNQFSMSEFEGFLRIATTIGEVSKGSTVSKNNVYTIDLADSELPIAGRVEGLAAGEKIYAVRFIGPRGFVVTFKKVDPLFTIDLSNPLEPEVTGELKVPGYSTYLHPFGEDNLIGLGFDADDMGNFAWFQGMQLSLFNVADPANPTRDHNVVIGTRGTNSESIMDHHAFTFDTTRNLLAIPVDLAEGAAGGGSYGTCSYAGMHVYRVSLDNGFDLVSEIKRTDLGCKASWWDSTSQAKRSIILGDGVSEGVIVVWRDRVDLYNLIDTSLIGSENVILPQENYYTTW